MQNPTDAATYKSLIAIQPDGTKGPFFCVHANGRRLDSSSGAVLSYATLAYHLGSDQPFYLLQPVGIAGDDEPLTSVETMASLYISELKTVQPAGPYHIGGYQTGALIALEVSHQLLHSNDEVALLAFIDVSPELFSAKRNDSFPQHRNGSSPIKRALWNTFHRWTQRAGKHMPRILWNTDLAVEYALGNYEPIPFPGLVSLFLPQDFSPDPSDWSSISSVAVDIHTVDSKPDKMLVEPGVRSLGQQLIRLTSPSNVATTKRHT